MYAKRSGSLQFPIGPKDHSNQRSALITPTTVKMLGVLGFLRRNWALYSHLIQNCYSFVTTMKGFSWTAVFYHGGQVFFQYISIQTSSFSIEMVRYVHEIPTINASRLDYQPARAQVCSRTQPHCRPYGPVKDLDSVSMLTADNPRSRYLASGTCHHGLHPHANFVLWFKKPLLKVPYIYLHLKQHYPIDVHHRPRALGLDRAKKGFSTLGLILTSSILLGVIFCAIHLAAWNYYSHTHAERIIQKTCSCIAIACCMETQQASFQTAFRDQLAEGFRNKGQGQYLEDTEEAFDDIRYASPRLRPFQLCRRYVCIRGMHPGQKHYMCEKCA